MSDFYTVSQYAAITGKDVGNIRRLLINGVLKGEKVGNQWLIPKGTTLPTDQRVKSGEYRNWRKKTELMKRYPELTKSVGRMSREISKVYGNVIDRIVLYGSYARGQENDESDMDIAVFLKKSGTEEQHDKMTDIVVDYELDLGITLSVIAIDQESYTDWNETLPFYKNIDKEGIILWKKPQKEILV